METKIKQKRDWDSLVERNLQRDGQEGVDANIPRVASTIIRLNLEQKKLPGVERRLRLREKKKAAGQANTDKGSIKRREQRASTSGGGWIRHF